MTRVVAVVATLALLCGSANAVLIDFSTYGGTASFTDTGASDIVFAFTGAHSASNNGSLYAGLVGNPVLGNSSGAIGDVTLTIPSGTTLNSVSIYDFDTHPSNGSIDTGEYGTGAGFTSLGTAFSTIDNTDSAEVLDPANTLTISPMGAPTTFVLKNLGTWGAFSFAVDYDVTAVPEPSAFLAMVFAGIPCAAVGYFRRRKQIAAA